MGAKMEPKVDPREEQGGELILFSSGPHFGTHFGIFRPHISGTTFGSHFGVQFGIYCGKTEAGQGRDPEGERAGGPSAPESLARLYVDYFIRLIRLISFIRA